jgi:small-conductance mechanosensitive channel
MRWFGVAGPLTALALWLVLAPPAAAQPAAVAGETTAAVPRAVSAAAIPARARADVASLAALAGRIPGDSALARLARELSTLSQVVEADAGKLTDARLAAAYFEDLADLEQRWTEVTRRLASWRTRAGVMMARADAIHDTTTVVRTVWDLTRRLPRGEVPAPLRAQVDDVLRAADSLDARAGPVRDRLLQLQSEATALETRVGAHLVALRAAQSRLRRQILRRDGPALWNLRRAAWDSTAARDTDPGTDKFAQAVAYLGEQPGRLGIHGALFVAFVVLFTLLGRRRDRWTTAEFATHWPASLLAHPIAAAALLAVAVMRPLYPGAPQGLFALGFLAVLPALIILLRQLLIPTLRVPAYVLVAVYSTRVLADTFVAGQLVTRVGLLITAVAGAAAFTWFAWLAGRVPERSRRAWRAGRVLALVGVGLLAGAVVANVLGFVTLTALLVSATLVCGLAALAVVALVDVVVGAVLVGLLATPIARLEMVRRNRTAVTWRVTTLVQIAGLVTWISVAMRQFRILDPALDVVTALLAAPIAVGSWNFTVGDLAAFAISLVLAVVIARGLRAVLRDDVLSRLSLGRGVPEAAAGLAYYAMLALGFVFATGAAGLDLSRLALIAGALSVGIGFGLQNIVANFISGLILLIERPVHSGDTVEFDGLRGVIQSIGMRASIVRTFQGADVIVPNQEFISGRVVNWTLSDQTRRVEIPVGVAYGTSPNVVISLLTETAGRHPRVLEEPPPSVLFTGFGESSLDFEIRLWTNAHDWPTVRSDVLVAAHEALAQANIEIPFPQRDLHIRSVAPAVREWATPPSP